MARRAAPSEFCATLDLVLAVPSDEHEERLGTASVSWTFERDDWDRPSPGMLADPGEDCPVADPEPPDADAAAALIEQYCRRRGSQWHQRRAAWAVRALPDGRILSALEDVALECWRPDSAEVEWRLPAVGKGCQIVARPTT
jgi:hypothetical protein